jgi:hypothetical protein
MTSACSDMPVISLQDLCKQKLSAFPFLTIKEAAPRVGRIYHALPMGLPVCYFYVITGKSTRRSGTNTFFSGNGDTASRYTFLGCSCKLHTKNCTPQGCTATES